MANAMNHLNFTQFVRWNGSGKVMIVLWVAACIVAACGVPAEPASLPDQSTPEATIRSLYDAINRSDVRSVELLVESGDKDSADFIKGLKEIFASGATWEASNLEVDIPPNYGNIVKAQARLYEKLTLKSGQVYMEGPTSYLLMLIKKGERWYFRGLGQQVPPGWMLP
jgi:hypothetical protein